jgi:hypothetical protein
VVDWINRLPRPIRFPIVGLIFVVTSPVWVPIKLLVRFRPDKQLEGYHEEADRLFYIQRWKELADFCEGSLWLFPGDEKLTSLLAIALAETDPDRAAELTRRVGI